MKLSILSSLLILSACTHAPVKQPLSELEAMLSPEDLKIHQCLHSGKEKKECLVGTPYEGYLTRAPSSDDELVMKNNWFFDSKENLEKFYKVSRGFLRAQALLVKKTAGKLVNKKGIAVEGSVYAGVGRGWAAEFAVHQNKLGFFCSPSWSFQTDVGFEADVGVSRSLSCSDNEAYAGDDVSFGASMSGELIGLPVGLSLSYSMSIEPTLFKARIDQAKRSGLLNLRSLTEEMRILNSPEMRRELAKSYRYALPLLTLVLKPISLMELRSPAMANQQGLYGFVRDMIKNDRSLGMLFKTYYSRQLRNMLDKERLYNLNAFLGALDAAITGCDALGGSASVGASLSPISAGVSYSKSILLAEVGAPELTTFASLTAMSLLNPFMLPSQDLRNVVKVARSLVAIPVKVQRQCLK